LAVLVAVRRAERAVLRLRPAVCFAVLFVCLAVERARPLAVLVLRLAVFLVWLVAISSPNPLWGGCFPSIYLSLSMSESNI
jgi:hypothetical protein